MAALQSSFLWPISLSGTLPSLSDILSTRPRVHFVRAKQFGPSKANRYFFFFSFSSFSLIYPARD